VYHLFESRLQPLTLCRHTRIRAVDCVCGNNLGVQMKRKVFSGVRRAIVERQAESWLARQAPSFDLHAAITQSRGRAAGVTVTVLYNTRSDMRARHINRPLAA
jgi:hypothetical protein